jgi:hypothetical protein
MSPAALVADGITEERCRWPRGIVRTAIATETRMWHRITIRR